MFLIFSATDKLFCNDDDGGGGGELLDGGDCV
jgi:hypothetical protein